MGTVLVIGGRYQGKRKFASETFPGRTILFLKDIYDSEELEKALSGNVVIIAEENSSGIVSADPSENRFREEYNHALLLVADRAEEVYRVFCGIPKMIKPGRLP